MTHVSDDDLVLHYYGEAPDADAHLASCPACARRARELALLLGAVPDEVPERGEHYGLDVWQRVRPHLEARHPWWRVFTHGGSARWALAAAAVAVLAVSSFVAGRFTAVPSNPDVTTTQTAGNTQTNGDVTEPGSAGPHGDVDARRVLLLSVADHLERSDRVLTDIVNAPGGVDLSAEQQWAADLVAINRLFRQDALDADEASVADVLDELERTLIDIVHRPAGATAADFEQIRRRIDSAALLFKVRVMTNELRQQQFAPDASRRSSTPIS